MLAVSGKLIYDASRMSRATANFYAIHDEGAAASEQLYRPSPSKTRKSDTCTIANKTMRFAPPSGSAQEVFFLLISHDLPVPRQNRIHLFGKRAEVSYAAN